MQSRGFSRSLPGVCRGGRLCPPASSIFRRTPGHVCRGRCPHRPKGPLYQEGAVSEADWGSFLKPFFSFSFRKKRTVSIFQEKKECFRNRECKPCRHRVRRRLLHCASAGAAKAPYPQSPSSFPNCDRFTGSQFGFSGLCRAARYLDDGVRQLRCDFHTPQVQSKALADGESGEPFERFPGRLFLFLAARHGSFLSPNRERKEWGRKMGR